MVILYYEIQRFRIIDVPGCKRYVADFAERISFAEHWKLVAESSEFHLTLSRAHRAHFSQLEIRKKKRDILSVKRESGMSLKSVSLRPKAVVLTPTAVYVTCECHKVHKRLLFMQYQNLGLPVLSPTVVM